MYRFLLFFLSIATLVESASLPTETQVKRNLEEWQRFMERTNSQIPAPKNLPWPSDKVALIVETRKEPQMSYILRNVMHFLGEGWGLCIIHGSENEEYIKEITKGWGQVHLHNIQLGKFKAIENAYVKILLEREFWEVIPAEKILVFQTDSMMCHGGIDEWLEYDYVGAPWPHKIARGEEPYVGNGGFSLRTRSMMLEAIEKQDRTGLGEDGVFSTWAANNGYKVPSVEEASRFSTESMYNPDSLAWHAAYKYLSQRQFRTLLSRVSYE